MPNKTGGSKFKKQKKNNDTERKIVYKSDKFEDQQEYARVDKLLGHCRIMVSLPNKDKKMGIICGRMKGRSYISIGDIIIVSLRGYQDDKVDVIHKYSNDDVKVLKKDTPDVKTLVNDIFGGENAHQDDEINWEYDGDDQEVLTTNNVKSQNRIYDIDDSEEEEEEAKVNIEEI